MLVLWLLLSIYLAFSIHVFEREVKLLKCVCCMYRSCDFWHLWSLLCKLFRMRHILQDRLKWFGFISLDIIKYHCNIPVSHVDLEMMCVYHAGFAIVLEKLDSVEQALYKIIWCNLPLGFFALHNVPRSYSLDAPHGTDLYPLAKNPASIWRQPGEFQHLRIDTLR